MLAVNGFAQTTWNIGASDDGTNRDAMKYFVTATLSADHTQLTIRSKDTLDHHGPAAMRKWGEAKVVPWHSHRATIRNLQINGVTSISDFAFQGFTALEQVFIPNSVKTIGDWAFADSDTLGIVMFLGETSITNVGREAFSGTKWYRDAPGDIYIGSLLYKYKHNPSPPGPAQLREGGATAILREAFANCDSITGINLNPIPSNPTLHSIGVAAFRGCSMLDTIFIPRSVTSIGAGAFEGCHSLRKIDVDPDNPVFKSVDGVLYKRQDDALILLTYPVKKAETSLYVPNEVTSIGYAAFAGCDSLVSVIFTGSSRLESIADRAFHSCDALTALTIPDGVGYIGDAAFWACSGLTTVTIPESVTTIGSFAFSNCDKLESLTVKWDNPITVPSNVFGTATLNSCTLNVPLGKESLYKLAPVWKDFYPSSMAIEPGGRNTPLPVYPNPTTGVVYIGNGVETHYATSLHTLNGELLLRTNENRIDLSGYPRGIYLLQSGGKTVKIVKK
ncbi:T9SS C-terminal target domain-containing protein [Bacteroidia bacterium]|nr:T9SS C-terminal target domain-containing protein [Bacteroidia bacterium]